MSWADAKFNHCVFGISPEEEYSSEEEEEEVRRQVPGIVPISSEMPNIGYTVEKPVGDSIFVGIVIVPNKMTPGDLFRMLETLFGSKNEIDGIKNNNKITSFKERMELKYKNCQEKLVEGCSERLFHPAEIKWWSLDEMKEICSAKAKGQEDTTNSEKVIIIKNKIGNGAPSAATCNAKIKNEIGNVAPSAGAGESRKDAPAKLEENKQVNEKKNSNERKSEERMGAKDAAPREGLMKEESSVVKDIIVPMKNVEDKNKLDKLDKEVQEKDKEIAQLKVQIREINAAIDLETENAKVVMKQKEDLIKILSDEIKVMEKQVRDLKTENAVLTNANNEWIDGVEEEEGRVNQEALDLIKEEKIVLENEKKELEEKVFQTEEEMKEQRVKVDELKKQLKEITDNNSFLAAELVRQKGEFNDELAKQKAQASIELKQEKSNLKEEAKRLEETRKDLGTKEEEIVVLKQKLADLQTTSYGPKLDEILDILKEKNVSMEMENPRRGQFSQNHYQENIQVTRFRKKEPKVLIVGHPKILKNFESIPTLRKILFDLMKSGHIEILTGDYEGFQLRSLIDKVSALMKKPLYSEATDENIPAKREFSTVVVFPGNHFEAMEYLENNKGKPAYFLNSRLETSVVALKNDIVELLNTTTGNDKEIVVVFDPANDQTYKHSREMMNTFNKSLEEWKVTLSESDAPKISVWDLGKEQMEAGLSQSDKQKTWEIVENGKNIFLHREALTSDGSGISKKMTIETLNRLVDHVSGSPSGAPVYDQCGIQQPSRYSRCRCDPQDMGEYDNSNNKGCQACGKAGHEIGNCWSMNFKAEKVCGKAYCSKKGLKHSLRSRPHQPQVPGGGKKEASARHRLLQAEDEEAVLQAKRSQRGPCSEATSLQMKHLNASTSCV